MGVDASHMAARMAWMAEAKPDLWAATRSVLLPKDWVIGQLTGAFVSDPVSQIGAVGQNGTFIGDLFERIDGGARRLPDLRDPASVAGEARLPGAERPVPVATGLMDAWASMFGVGVKDEGDAMYLSGTSEIPGVISAKVHPAEGALVFPPHMGLTLHAAPTQSGGASLAWLCRMFDATPEVLMAEVAAAKPAPALFLPHLSGERAPLWDASARGRSSASTRPWGGPRSRARCWRAWRCRCGWPSRRSTRPRGRMHAAELRRGRICLGHVEPDPRRCAGPRSAAAGRARPRGAGRGGAGRGGRGASARSRHRAGRGGALRHHLQPDPEGQARAEALYELYRPAYEAARVTNHALAGLG
jgi:xylulokinase